MRKVITPLFSVVFSIIGFVYADLQLSFDAESSLRATYWVGRVAFTNHTTMRYGEPEARPAVTLSDGMPDYDRHGEPMIPFVRYQILLPPDRTAGIMPRIKRAWPQSRRLDQPRAFIDQPRGDTDMTDPEQAAAWTARAPRGGGR